MNRIPIGDASVPVACTAGAGELSVRKDQLRRLRDAVPVVERTAHGLVLRFPAAGAVADEVEAFVVAEQGCCAFWGFEVTRAGEQLSLRWDGPPEVGSVLDGLVAFFVGDADPDVLDGLL